MPAYLVEVDRTKQCAADGPQGVNSMVVFAASTAQAKEIAKAEYDGGDGDARWTDATVTEIVQATVNNWVGWRFKMVARKASEDNVELDYTAVDDTIDEVGAAMVVVQNARSDISASAYNSTTNVFSFSGIADNLGDYALTVEIFPPGKQTPVASLVGTIVDEGSAGAVLSVALPSDTAVIPAVRAKYFNAV